MVRVNSSVRFLFSSTPRTDARAALPFVAALFVVAALAPSASAQQIQRPAPPATREWTPAAPPALASPVAPAGTYAPAAAPALFQSPGRASHTVPGRAAQRTPPAPRNVVTVVHRLSGWKLLSWIAARAGEGVFVDELPSADDVHTNIVAGVVSEDGRTVAARLPRAEVEVEWNAVAPPQGFYGQTIQPGAHPSGFTLPPGAQPSGFTLIRGDGKVVEAKFVGLDAATGLSFLEAKEPLWAVLPAPAAPAPGARTAVPAVGQLVHLYAPTPAAAPRPPAATPAPRVAHPAPFAPVAPVSPVGDTGTTEVIYLSLAETQAKLTDIRREPSGRPVVATVRAQGITPAKEGAAVVSSSGELFGILGTAGETDSEVVTAESMRRARERVLAGRRSVPRPLLGVRGEAMTKSLADQLMSKGGPFESAVRLLQNEYGVLLKEVVPGAPAERAGLKPGDIISRVGGRKVKGVEEFTRLLREAGAGARVELEVLRAVELAPLKLSVELSGTYGVAVSNLLTYQGFSLNPLQPFGLRTVGLTEKQSATLGARGGQLVVNVQEGSPAAAAGLLTGDVIESVNGQPFTRLRYMSLLHVEQPQLDLEVVRKGEKLNCKLTAPRKGARP